MGRHSGEGWLAGAGACLVALALWNIGCQEHAPLSSDASAGLARKFELSDAEPPKPLRPTPDRQRVAQSLLSGNESVASPARLLHHAPSRWVQVFLGDGWGCALQDDRSYACWNAAASRIGAKIAAQNVAWLDGSQIVVGPDRLCRRERAGLRCWRAPDFLDDGGKDGLLSPSATESWQVLDLAAPGEAVRDFQPVTHGAWAGCSPSWYCWGNTRSPAAARVCQVGSLFVPCAIADEPTLREFSHIEEDGRWEQLVIGDLYACKAMERSGLICVGASREGLFGTAKDCPSELLASWPNLDGGVPAPRATCSRSPVFVKPGDFSCVYGTASPSSLCVAKRGAGKDGYDSYFPACFGVGVGSSKLDRLVVGLGEQPSACGIDADGRVACWGNGYSLDAAGHGLVYIQPAPRGPAMAWDEPGKYERTCAINHDCGRVVRPLPACTPEAEGLDVSAVLALVRGLAGKRVAVRGSLGLNPIRPSGELAVICDSKDNCCSESGEAPLLVMNGEQRLIVEGSFCYGDSSRTCCSLPVRGQSVIARGVLEWREGARHREASWTLVDPELCEAGSAAPARVR